MARAGHPNPSEDAMLAPATPQDVLGHVGQELGQSEWLTVTQEMIDRFAEATADRLICVRYRYDAQRKKRFKTVELLVDERDWQPPRPRFAHDQIVGRRVPFA